MRNLPYPLLLDSVPEIFANQTPGALIAFSPNINLEPWKLAEEAVFGFFRYVLALNARKLGSDTLFQHEPEGRIVGLGPDHNRALIYECKCRAGSYNMSRDDLLRYQDYMRLHAGLVQVFNLQLTNIVIIAPSFSGEYEEKFQELSEGGINVSGLTAPLLRHFFHEVKEWGIEQIALLDLCRIFHTGHVEIVAIDDEVSRASHQYILHAL